MWEERIANRGIDVFCYDTSIDGIDTANKKLHFEKIGISGVDDTCECLLSLDTIVKRNGDIYNYNLLLKMDVEGAEWNFLLEPQQRY